jgi:hypothetical protein
MEGKPTDTSNGREVNGEKKENGSGSFHAEVS